MEKIDAYDDAQGPGHRDLDERRGGVRLGVRAHGPALAAPGSGLQHVRNDGGEFIKGDYGDLGDKHCVLEVLPCHSAVCLVRARGAAL